MPKDDSRERERIARTGQHLRKEWARAGLPPLSVRDSQEMVRIARIKGEKDRGE